MAESFQPIIKQCLKGNQKAQYALYRLLYGKLMAICKRYESNEDDALALLNSGFYKVLTQLKKYDNTKPFEPWAKRVQINVILDHYRRDKRFRNEVASDFQEENIELDIVVLNEIEERLETQYLLEIIESLPKATKTVFYMHVVEGLDYAEIANELKISKGTIKWHVAKAREGLKAQFEAFVKSAKILLV